MNNDYCCYIAAVVVILRYRNCSHGKCTTVDVVIRLYVHASNFHRVISNLISWDRNFQSRGIGDSL